MVSSVIILQGINIEECHPMSSWSNEKMSSFLMCLFSSVQNVYLWFGARYGFDSLTLIAYTSGHATSNAIELMRRHKIGKKQEARIVIDEKVHIVDRAIKQCFRSKALGVLGPVPRHHDDQQCPHPHHEGILHLLLSRRI